MLVLGFLSVARTCFWAHTQLFRNKIDTWPIPNAKPISLSTAANFEPFDRVHQHMLLDDFLSSFGLFLSIIFCFVFILSTAVSQSSDFKMHSNIDFVIIKLLKSPFLVSLWSCRLIDDAYVHTIL